MCQLDRAALPPRETPRDPPVVYPLRNPPVFSSSSEQGRDIRSRGSLAWALEHLRVVS
jgi:hypothetical protein